MNRSPRLSFLSPSVLAIQFDVGAVERGLGAEPDRFTGTPVDEALLFDPNNYSLVSSSDSTFSSPVNPTDEISLKAKTTDVAFLNQFNKFDPNQVKWTQEYTVYLPLSADLTAGETYTLNFTGALDAEIADIPDFTFRPRTTFSEAIHVSQVGFDPDDPKVAFLSQWLGTDKNGDAVSSAANFEAGQRFWIVDAATGTRVEGTARRAQLSLAATEDEDVRGGFQNYAGTDVYELDFSDFNQVGEYFIEVEGVGRSFDFKIAENTWERAFQVSMKGLYNQRSGTAIGGPFSNTEYQRSFHPDDGINIIPTDARTATVNGQQVSVAAVQLIDTEEGELGDRGFGEAFAEYVAPFDQNGDGDITSGELTEQIAPLSEAWGGYKDAGDWDRRIQHLFGTRQHLELADLFPDYFEQIDLNIPETTESFVTVDNLNGANPDNGIPDIVDESLWSLDFFRRLQTPDGGIRGGIESAAAPRAGETSWQESLNVFAYAPDPWSSYIYAGVAARTARVLQQYDPDLANVYEDSAIRAMNWAENERPTDPKYDRIEIRDQRNLAALELYLLTETSRWNRIFLEDTVFAGEQCGPGQPCADVFENEEHDQQQAAFLYARAPERLTDAVIRGNTAGAIARAADNSLAVQNGGNITFNGAPGLAVNGTAFKWTKNRAFTPLVSGQLATPQVDALLQAHTLTGQSKYLEGAVLGSQFAVGANPSNTVFTSGLANVGLADREAQNPFVIDARLTGQSAPAGITSYGPLDSNFGFNRGQTNLFRDSTSPDPEQWPVAEAYFDNYWNFQNTEFTIHQSIAPTAYAWGYFAASDFEGTEPIVGTPGNDTLVGTNGNDTLLGLAGNDRLQGLAGDDSLDGGPGRDRIFIRNFDGVDTINGGSGSDMLILSPFDDRDLTISVGRGQVGDGRIGGQRFRNVEEIVAGAGDDTLIGDRNNNILSGNDGDDDIRGGAGNDRISGGVGDDTLQGDAGNDLIAGATGNDQVIVKNFSGVDRFDGGPGNDIIRFVPSDGRDLTIFVERGQVGDGRTGGQRFRNFEQIFSGAGDDNLIGDAQGNVLNGGAGDDNLDGGTGNDTLNGGTGSDTFQFGANLLDGIADSDLIASFGAADQLDFTRYLNGGGSLEAQREGPNRLRIDLSGEDRAIVTGAQAGLDAAEAQITALAL